MSDLENTKKVESGIYSKGKIDIGSIVKSIKQNSNIIEAGSIHTFTGIVRNTSKNGKSVVSMKIDAYDELANEKIGRASCRERV